MPKVYVSEYDDNGVARFALYADNGDKSELLQEDWKPVLFDTEEEAATKLADIEAEKAREDTAIPFSPEEAEKYAESHYWKFATTYAKTAPHEYMIKKWLVDEDKLLFERFVATIKVHAVTGYFYSHENKYLILGEHYYWYMPLPDNMAVDLINRTYTTYLEYRDGVYHYKGKD